MLISFVSSLYEQYLFVGEVKYEDILYFLCASSAGEAA